MEAAPKIPTDPIPLAATLDAASALLGLLKAALELAQAREECGHPDAPRGAHAPRRPKHLR